MKELLNRYQKGIYNNELLYPNSSINNIGGYIEFCGRIDADKMHQAVQSLINSQSALRTILFIDGDNVYQRVEDVIKFHLKIRNITGNDVHKYIKEVFCTPFHIFGQPLYYFELLQVEDDHFYLIVKLRHLIADGWSMQLANDTIDRYYFDEEFCGHIYEYRSFHDEYEKYTKSKRFCSDDNYWDQKIKEIEEVSITSSHNSIDAKRKNYYFDVEVSDMIYRFTKEKNISINQFFMSVWGVLLNYINGENKQYIGMPIYNRRNAESKRTIGSYTNIVPLVLDVDAEQTIEQYLCNTKNTIYNSMRHSMYPYSNILDKFRGIKTEHTYQYIFNYFNMSFGESCCGCKCRVENVFPDAQPYMLQLSLYEWDMEQGIGVSFDYATDSCDEAQIDYYYAMLERFCLFAVKNKEKQISDFDFMSDKDKEDLEKFNSNKIVNDHESNIFSLFMEQVDQFHDRVAVCDGENKYTYSEFYTLVNKYIAYLENINVVEGDFVCIHVNHSVNSLAVIWAIVYVGAIFVPIEKKWPENKKHMIFEQTNAKIIFVDDTYCYKAFSCINVYECIDGIHEAVLTQRQEGRKALYLLYTSGTTGEPKGVLVSNESLCNYLMWASNEYKISSVDVLPLFSSISFDFTLTTIFLPIISGAMIIIYNDSDVVHPIYKILEDNRSTVVKVTPSHLNIIATGNVMKSNIRAFIIGGEKLYSETIHNAAKVLGGNIDYYNEYGPTEATIGCMTYLCNQDESSLSVPIGTPINNTEIYLLNPMLKPVGKYKWAEMYIAGKGLAIGYYNNDAQTKKVFVTSKYIGTKRLYKTGDIARFNSDGNMEYLGRNDGQIKVNGYRIELDEIYSAVIKLEEVNNCAIEVVKEAGSEYLVAYLVVNEQDTEAFTVELKSYLSEQLVHYMIPKKFLYVDDIPLTTNGKVDILTLSKKRKEIDSFKGKVTPSCNELSDEDSLLLIEMKQIFNRENISISSSFIELGGDSIKAIIIAQKLYQRGYSIKIQDIMFSSSLAEVSRLMKREKTDMNKKILSDRVELTPIVYRFLKIQDIDSNDSSHEVTIQLHNEIKDLEFKNILKQVIGNHPALMLNVSSSNDYLYYNKECTNHFVLTDYEANTDICFDLHKDLLFKVQKKDSRTYKIIINHLVVDLVSWSILLNEIDYLLSSTNHIQQLKPERSLYENYVATNPYHENVLLFQRQREKVNKSKIIQQFDLQQYTTQIQKIKAKYGLTIDKFFLYVLGYHFNYMYGKDVIFELESHGRDVHKEELSNVVGWFTKVTYQRFSKNHGILDFDKYIVSNSESKESVRQEDFSEADVIRYNFLGDSVTDYLNFSVVDQVVSYKYEDRTDYLYEFDLQLKQEKELIIYTIFETKAGQEERVKSFILNFMDTIDKLLNYEISQKAMEIEYVDDDLSLEDIEYLTSDL